MNVTLLAGVDIYTRGIINVVVLIVFLIHWNRQDLVGLANC